MAEYRNSSSQSPVTGRGRPTSRGREAIAKVLRSRMYICCKASACLCAVLTLIASLFPARRRHAYFSDTITRARNLYSIGAQLFSGRLRGGRGVLVDAQIMGVQYNTQSVSEVFTGYVLRDWREASRSDVPPSPWRGRIEQRSIVLEPPQDT